MKSKYAICFYVLPLVLFVGYLVFLGTGGIAHFCGVPDCWYCNVYRIIGIVIGGLCILGFILMFYRLLQQKPFH